MLRIVLSKSISSKRTQIVRRILIHWRHSIYDELLLFWRQISLHEEAPAQLEITRKRSHFGVVGVDSVRVEPAIEVGPWVLNDWKIYFLIGRWMHTVVSPFLTFPVTTTASPNSMGTGGGGGTWADGQTGSSHHFQSAIGVRNFASSIISLFAWGLIVVRV